ncbi:tail fiber assembly protein [Salmonella enterica]
MTMYYSAKNNAFYALALKGKYEESDEWPEDGVEIDDELYASFFSQPPDGKVLGSDSSGIPSWVDAPALSQEQLIAQAVRTKQSLRAIADSEIEWRQDAVDADIAKTEEVAALAAWKIYRVLLMRVDTAKPVWPELPMAQA